MTYNIQMSKNIWNKLHHYCGTTTTHGVEEMSQSKLRLEEF